MYYTKTICTFLIFTAMSLMYSCGGNSNYDTAKEGIKEKYNCDNVDDCMAKYDFEAARAYMAAEESENGMGVYSNLPKITQAESVYLAKQGEYERALNIVNEANQINYTEIDKQAVKYTVLEMAVNKYCEDGDYKKAKIMALKASESYNMNGYEINNIDVFEADTQQAVLLNKIKKYQELID